MAGKGGSPASITKPGSPGCGRGEEEYTGPQGWSFLAQTPGLSITDQACRNTTKRDP